MSYRASDVLGPMPPTHHMIMKATVIDPRGAVIREWGKPDARILAVYGFGERLTVTDRWSKHHQHVLLPQGQEGWVFIEAIRFPKRKPYLSLQAARVIRVAEGKLGAPYTWRAKGPDAFDCSGFVAWAFQEALGWSLPTGSLSLRKRGVDVPVTEIKPGDLLFYHPEPGTQIDHVAIFAGDGQMIHAENVNTGVVRTGVNQPAYASRFAMARRIL